MRNTRLFVHFCDPPQEKSLKLLGTLLNGRFQISTGVEIKHQSILDYLICGRPRKEDINNCPNLKAVIIPFAGVPSSLAGILKGHPQISVHNLHHNAVPVVEHTLALVLAAAKNIIPPHNALCKNDWRPRYAHNPSVLLQGKTALILGYGEIGSRLAFIFHALDMKVVAIRKSITIPSHDSFTDIYPSTALHTVLPQTDILINTLPLTAQTEGMIAEKELALLPQGSIVVNVGRGKVIDQHSFYNALKNGHLGAAAIDVWYQYPQNDDSRSNTMPAESPFGQLDNVVLSPHRAGGLNSDATERLRMEHLAHLLNHAARGEPLPNQIDLHQGY